MIIMKATYGTLELREPLEDMCSLGMIILSVHEETELQRVMQVERGHSNTTFLSLNSTLFLVYCRGHLHLGEC